jgi:hypothetical protein
LQPTDLKRAEGHSHLTIASLASAAPYSARSSRICQLLLLSNDDNSNLSKSQWRRLNQPNRRVVMFLFSAARKIANG